MSDETVICPKCRKELCSNGEDSFRCPYCGTLVVCENHGAGHEESVEDRLRRLENEVERSKLSAAIEKQAAEDWYWRNPLRFFAGMDRSSARDALERGDLEAAREHLQNGEKTSNAGCVLALVIAIVVVIAIFCS